MRKRNIDSARYTRKVIKEVKAMMMEIAEPKVAYELIRHIMLLDNTWAPILANQIYEYAKMGKPPNRTKSRVMREMFRTGKETLKSLTPAFPKGRS